MKLELKGENIEVEDKMKILGTIVDKSLSWDENCQHLIRKVNARMQLLRSVFSFGASNSEMVHIWIFLQKHSGSIVVLMAQFHDARKHLQFIKDTEIIYKNAVKG